MSPEYLRPPRPDPLPAFLSPGYPQVPGEEATLSDAQVALLFADRFPIEAERLVSRYGFDPEIEDIVQSAAIAAWRALSRRDWKGKRATTVVRYACRDQVASWMEKLPRRQSEVCFSRLALPATVEGEAQRDDWLAGNAWDGAKEDDFAPRLLDALEEEGLVAGVLRSATPAQATALFEYYWLNRSQQEIADRRGVHISGVQQLLYGALKRYRKAAGIAAPANRRASTPYRNADRHGSGPKLMGLGATRPLPYRDIKTELTPWTR